jgi:3-dehydroquinate synthetase
MKKDKKNSSSTVRFVLQSDIKKTIIQEVSDLEVIKIV